MINRWRLTRQFVRRILFLGRSALMRTVPRHLVLAAIVLTVCCAERQAVPASHDLAQMAAEIARASAKSSETRARREQERQIPAAAKAATSAEKARRSMSPVPTGFGSLVESEREVLHRVYPPDRFRLPPPSFAC